MGRPRTMNPQKVLDLAMTEYWHSDVTEVSVNAICKKAEISKPSLYREFGSEDGLMRAALDQYLEDILPKVFNIFAEDVDLKNTMAALIEYACDHPTTEYGCLFYKMHAARHRVGPQTRERVEEMVALSRTSFAELLESRRQAGDWNSTMSSELAARYLVDQIGFALMQRASGEDPEGIRETLNLALSAIDGPRA
ncbi:MAG: TetR/AcrR family transcriptional regulator [Pseudomonadota bacterium]